MISSNNSQLSLATCLAMAFFLLPVSAETRDPQSTDAFDTADLDGDGVLVSDEYRLFVIEEFYFADTNRDGQVSGEDQHEWEDTRMQATDSDASGGVNMQEFVNAARRDYVDIDIDNNDILTREEVDEYNDRLP